MKYYSTNRRADTATVREAVLRGMPADRGLYMPERIPRLDEGFFATLGKKTLAEIGVEVGREFFAPDVPETVLAEMLGEALNFPVPLKEIEDGVFVLELFHGPTLAFKDVGARVMARVMGYFAGGNDRELTVLVATSGDTGSAVAHAFYGVPGIRVAVLYPSGKVSRLQEQQIATLNGNITALEVKGTFDDCQRLVKEAFLDQELRRRCLLTSANSINIARWIPQSFYYFYGMGQLPGERRPLAVSVPSGNLGNVTAGLLARAIGLEVDWFVTAANRNRAVVDYLETREYRARPSVKTLSNAMDVGDPSNIARLMDLYDGEIERIRRQVVGFSFDDDETVAAIEAVKQEFGYVMDPHGAVGYLGLKKWMTGEPKMQGGVFLETAHPAKFGGDVEMPERLRACLGKEKRSLGLDADFDAFKEFLLEWSGDSW